MKRFSLVLMVFSLFVGLITTAAAPRAAGNVTLVGAGYVDGKGVVFTFHVDGKVSKSDMKGSVSVDGGGNYGLDCVKVDDETVKCTAPKAVAGHNVSVTWGGSTFWTHVQEIPSEYCYNVYDWDTVPTTEWVNYGSYCQDRPATYGAMIFWDNPKWNLSPYAFMSESPNQDVCLGKRSGDGYYFPFCFPPLP